MGERAARARVRARMAPALIEAQRQAWPLRCPACLARAGAAHADCALALALAACHDAFRAGTEA